jgi:hypothetical protein
MKINVQVDVPPGPTCSYPPKDGAVRGFTCQWILGHTGSGQKWCRLFDDANVTDMYKCKGCLDAVSLSERKSDPTENGG